MMNKISVKGLSTKEVNDRLRSAVAEGVKRIELTDVCGQRYIGTDLSAALKIDIYGTPGNDLGSFMNGPIINVFGNAQDGCGNTMNEGEIIVHGHAGDIAGFGMRGGKIFIRDDVGYRVGIHMKEYQKKKPILVIGGFTQDFLGEYMAGGILIVLGLSTKMTHNRAPGFIGTGMHGGVIYYRGKIEPFQLGKEVGVLDPDVRDKRMIERHVQAYAKYFKADADYILSEPFLKLVPTSSRPYGKLYAY